MTRTESLEAQIRTIHIPELDVEIYVTAEFNGEPLQIGDDGYLGEGFEGELRIRALDFESVYNDGVHAITVNDTKYVDRVDLVVDPEFEDLVYELRVGIRKTRDGKRYAVTSSNSLRLITVTVDDEGRSPKAYLKAWQVSIVGQNDKFWLVVNKTYDCEIARCKRIPGQLLQPMGCRWIAHHLLAEIIGDRWKDLPIKDWVPRKPVRNKVRTNDLGPNEGRVEFFDDAKGIASIATHINGKVKSAKVYWRDIAKRPGTDRRFLVRGEKVKCKGLKRPHKAHQSGFEYQAFGVRLIED